MSEPGTSRALARSLWAAIVCALAVGAGCAEAPPTAPTEYEELLGHIFVHMADDDTGELVAGLENLQELLLDDKLRADAGAGYSIHNLDQDAVNALDERERSTSGLVGISVLTNSPHETVDIGALLTWEDFGQVVADAFDVYEREFDGDPDCFGTQQCDWITAESHTESAWAGLIDMVTEYNIQFRWVDTSWGTALLHRFWLKAPAEGSCCDLVMRGNYYVGISFPDEVRGEGSLRVHANWFEVDYGLFPISQEKAMETVVENSKADADKLDHWISTH